MPTGHKLTVTTYCDRCGKECKPNGLGTGYGAFNEEGKTTRLCYACCAVREWDDMKREGKGVLYLDIDKEQVTNWPGSLVFKTGRVRKGRHNIARVRYDAWFRDGDGWVWHCVQYGDNTQIAHCKRTKERRV